MDVSKYLKSLKESHETKRFVKAAVTVVCTGIIAVYGEDPRYMVFIPVVDRLRAYLFRRLNID